MRICLEKFQAICFILTIIDTLKGALSKSQKESRREITKVVFFIKMVKYLPCYLVPLKIVKAKIRILKWKSKESTNQSASLSYNNLARPARHDSQRHLAADCLLSN